MRRSRNDLDEVMDNAELVAELVAHLYPPHAIMALLHAIAILTARHYRQSSDNVQRVCLEHLPKAIHRVRTRYRRAA